jgi:hypothetical protein
MGKRGLTASRGFNSGISLVFNCVHQRFFGLDLGVTGYPLSSPAMVLWDAPEIREGIQDG